MVKDDIVVPILIQITHGQPIRRSMKAEYRVVTLNDKQSIQVRMNEKRNAARFTGIANQEDPSAQLLSTRLPMRDVVAFASEEDRGNSECEQRHAPEVCLEPQGNLGNFWKSGARFSKNALRPSCASSIK